MIIHLPIFNVVVPANVSTLFEILIPIVMFDVLEAVPIPLIHAAYPLPDLDTFKATRIIDQVDDIGYDSYNPIHNLGSLGFYVILYIFKLVSLFLIVIPIYKITGKLEGMYRSMWRGVFFNDLLIIFVEGFLEFSLSTFLLYDAPEGHNDVDALTISIAAIGFFISNIVVPGLMLWILIFKDLKTINEPKFL